MPFYFLFALSIVSFAVLFFGVDLKKSRKEQEEFLKRKLEKLQRDSPSTDAEFATVL